MKVDHDITKITVTKFRQVISSRVLAYALAAISVIAGIATVLTMTGPFAQNYDIEVVVNLVYLDCIFLLLLAAVLITRMVRLWQDKTRGRTGSGLQTKLVGLFGLIAVTPAILVAIFAALYLNFGLQAWFSKRVSTALMESNIVANSYLEEHRKNFRNSVLSIANDLNFKALRLANNPRPFDQILTTHASIQSLSEAAVIDGAGTILGKMRFSLLNEGTIDISKTMIQKADTGAIVLLAANNADQARALIKLNRFFDTYLIIEKFLDSRVIRHINRIQNAVSEYQKLAKERVNFQISFVVIYIVVALLILMAAAWVGMTLANQLATPITDLIEAAQKISQGDLTARVGVSKNSDEISTLSGVFNKMTKQLESQRDGLMEANRKLDERRRFTETVLSGVSAGVIGLDTNKNIYLPNRSASSLLVTNLESEYGSPISSIVPEMVPLLDEVITNGGTMRQAEVNLSREGITRTFLVRIAGETLKNEIIGYVVTFDDVTALLSAQRKAAWSDIARRIAHEIKNPLTPIQLSAERLKAKYLHEITSDPEVFLSCTDTIVRQVGDIGRLVDEFSSFARMPEPSIQNENLDEICKHVIFLEKTRNPDLNFETKFLKATVFLKCDKGQVSRALANLLKNAAESVGESIKNNKNKKGEGRIILSIEKIKKNKNTGDIRVSIDDNGAGIRTATRHRLTEPYFTTRSGGSGLGLSIVQKIMEEHGGELLISQNKRRGARFSLIFKNIATRSAEVSD